MSKTLKDKAGSCGEAGEAGAGEAGEAEASEWTIVNLTVTCLISLSTHLMTAVSILPRLLKVVMASVLYCLLVILCFLADSPRYIRYASHLL